MTRFETYLGQPWLWTTQTYYHWRILCKDNCCLTTCSFHTFKVQQNIFDKAALSQTAPNQWVSKVERTEMAKSCPVNLLLCKTLFWGLPISLARLSFLIQSSFLTLFFPGSAGIVIDRLCLTVPAPSLHYPQKEPPKYIHWTLNSILSSTFCGTHTDNFNLFIKIPKTIPRKRV